MSTEDLVFKDFSVKSNPYNKIDKDTLEASINLLSIGTRFHEIDRDLSKQEINHFLPIMKDGYDCVNKILKIERKPHTTSFILEHKTLRRDLLESLEERDTINESESSKNIRESLDEEHYKMMSFIKTKVNSVKSNNENKLGSKSVIAYLEREVTEQQSRIYHHRELAIILIRTMTQHSSFMHDSNIRNLLDELLKMVKKENKEERAIINKMCKVINIV